MLHLKLLLHRDRRPIHLPNVLVVVSHLLQRLSAKSLFILNLLPLLVNHVIACLCVQLGDCNGSLWLEGKLLIVFLGLFQPIISVLLDLLFNLHLLLLVVQLVLIQLISVNRLVEVTDVFQLLFSLLQSSLFLSCLLLLQYNVKWLSLLHFRIGFVTPEHLFVARLSPFEDGLLKVCGSLNRLLLPLFNPTLGYLFDVLHLFLELLKLVSFPLLLDCLSFLHVFLQPSDKSCCFFLFVHSVLHWLVDLVGYGYNLTPLRSNGSLLTGFKVVPGIGC